MEKEIVYPIRINRYLALKNICSRREADEFIQKGKIAINGRVAALGDKVNAGDEVRVIQKLDKKYVYLAFNKPRNVITHSPQENEVEISEIINYPTKVFPVGRLDKDSHGLIILTNDGRVTDKLLNPEHNHEKEYVVAVDKAANEKFIEKMGKGVRLDDGYKTKECIVKKLKDRAFSIILTEGKKRQIRRMCLALGYEVTDLKRVRILNVAIGHLRPGQHRLIEGRELREFLGEIGMN